MFLMTKEEVEKEIRKVNTFLNDFLWMDFEVAMIDAGKIVIAGSIDLSIGKYDIDIEFEQPHFISTLLDWNTDPQLKSVIELVSEEDFTEFMEQKRRFRSQVGNWIFKINVSDDEVPIFIVASKIKCVILNQNKSASETVLNQLNMLP